MAVDYNELLYEKMQNEYNRFLMELDELLPIDVVRNAYQIVMKEDILSCFVDSRRPQIEAKALYLLQNPLDDLYQEWLGTDGSYMDMLRDTIDERAKSAVREMKEKQREGR